jgi:hypothetical protein
MYLVWKRVGGEIQNKTLARDFDIRLIRHMPDPHHQQTRERPSRDLMVKN